MSLKHNKNLEESIMKRTINRGDVFYANLKSDGTSRQSGIRPIVVVSNPHCNRFSPIISILSFTTSRTKHPLPTHVTLSSNETGLKYDSICLCEQPLSIAKTDLLEYITTLDSEHIPKISKEFLPVLRITIKSKFDGISI